MQKGPSYSASAATSPEKSANAQSRKSVAMRPCAFFSPSLDPVLDRRKRDKDTMVAPEVPACRAVGQAIFDHQPYRQINHAVGVLTAGWRQGREVGAKVLATLRTVMLGIDHKQITRTPQVEIPQIMERPMRLPVPIGRVTTTRARLPEVVATVGDDLGLWQVCGCGDPGAWVGSVLTWTEHRVALLVLHHAGSDGESRSSFLRASVTEKRQSMGACAALRWCSQAAIARLSVSSSGRRQSRHCCCRTRNAIAAMCHPLPCFGVYCNSRFLAMRRASAGSNA